MEAMILAGGLGTRLQAHTPGVPKALAPVGGRPFLAWLLDQLDIAGFRRVVLCVGYRRETIIGAFGNRYRGLELLYAIEESPLGTGGAICKGIERIGPGEAPIFVMNGDTIGDIAYSQMIAAHSPRSHDPKAITMALFRCEDTGRYGTVEISEGRVASFVASGGHGPGIVNSGVYLLHRRLFRNWTMPIAFSFEHEFLAPRISELVIYPFLSDGWFIDIGVGRDFARAQNEIPQRFGKREGVTPRV